MSQKSEDDTTTETPERLYINFIKDRLEKHGILNLQNLTGHLSSVPARVRNKFGTSKSCLKKFIKEHPESFKLDRRENVEIATDKYNRLDSISSDEGVSIQKLIDEAANMDVKPKINPSPGGSNSIDAGPVEIPHPRDDLPFELKEMKGKVYRIFQVYGFITVKNPRLQASVYFDLQSFENGKLESFTDGHLKIGEGVYLNARKGPDNCEAQYRASLVWRPESTEYFQGFSNGSQDSDAKEIRGCGKIHNLFPKYGFIARNTLVRDNVFFHLNNIVIPNEKEVNSLLDVFKIGDFVKFQAVPSEQKDSAIKWQASHVWLDHSATKDGNEIFMSDSESYDSASDRNDDDDEDYVEGVDNKNNTLDSENSLVTGKRPQIAINNSSTVSSLSPIALPFYSSSVLAGQINGDVSKFVTNQIGIIAAKTKDLAVIIFGERYMHRSITSLDVMYINCAKIKDFLLELGENARVHFDAIYQANGLYECNWKTTLVWIGKKPDLVVKRQVPPGANHVETALSSSTTLSTTDWASVVEKEHNQLDNNDSQSSKVSSTEPLFMPRKLESSKSQQDVLDKSKSPSPSTCSLFPQESKSLQINQPITYGTQSRFASQFSFANQGDTETSRISSQTFPLGMFSMSATPSGMVNSYPHYQSKASLHSTHPPHNTSSYMNPHFLPNLHNPTNNTVNYMNASEHSLLASSYSPSTSTGNFTNTSQNTSSISPPQSAILEKKVQDLTRQVENLMKQQDVSPGGSNENDKLNGRPKCYKEMSTQTDDYPYNERFSHPSNKITSTKHVQTLSTGCIMFSELCLDS